MYANAEAIQKMTRVYRTNMIENAYKKSDLHGYSIPRLVHTQSDRESEDIPLIYNLHSQNMAKTIATKIIPIKQLAKLKIERIVSSLRQNNCKLQENKADSCTKIKRTVNKMYAKNERKRIPIILCCDKEEQLEKYETREISIEQEQNGRAKIRRISDNKYRSIA